MIDKFSKNSIFFRPEKNIVVDFYLMINSTTEKHTFYLVTIYAINILKKIVSDPKIIFLL